MGTSTVDGTVEAAELKRSARGLSVFRSIRFRLADGSMHTITNAVAKRAVAEALQPGSEGRFYLFTGLDLKGVHGVRKPDGTAILDFPNGNRKAFLIVGLLSVAWIIFSIVTSGGLPLLGVGLLILAAVGYILLGNTEREAKAQFANDSGVPPSLEQAPA